MKTALISVSNKSNIIPLAKFLLSHNYQILSSGGTFNTLKQSISSDLINDISSYTNSPEILDGRVKTLHPKIYGGILAKRENESHLNQLNELDIIPIDLVIVNLYPFKEVISKLDVLEDDAIENIDIGGHTLIRAAAKNYKDVLVITSPNDYDNFMTNFNWINITVRKEFALKAFKHIMEYDAYISNYFNKINDNANNELDDTIIRVYEKQKLLKYGCNPQQKKAALYKNISQDIYPFQILNGNPGYINILDAIYSWNLVYELSNATNLPASASFKHTSPAGAAVYVPLSDTMKKVYNVVDKELTPIAVAFIRARNADPMCSYGDFIAISHEVDKSTAKIISIEISDGIIAPGYTSEALEILSKKKSGNYVILKANEFITNVNEIKELHGVTLIQEENTKLTTYEILENIMTHNKDLPDDAKRDLIVANVALKYAQSNSVAYAKDGQCIGIGAGQQSRIDCVKLAKQKATTWYLRQHPFCIGLFDQFKEGTKRQVKTNAVVKYIEGDFTDIEFKNWSKSFESLNILSLGNDRKDEFMKTIDNVSLASDAFFPFRDNIDTASKIGVKYILQPGGSIADDEVIEACNEYDMCMVFTGGDMRMFLH